MHKLLAFTLLVTLVSLAVNGLAEAAAPAAAPVVSPEALQSLTPEALGQQFGLAGISGEGLESWFFSFLEKLLALLANFIGQILQQVFGGIGGMLTPSA